MRSLKTKALWLVKFLTANVIAALLLSVFSYFYHDPNAQIPSIANETGCRYQPNARICRTQEGRFCGHVDANGYNNAYYIEHGKDVSQCDVLIFGSSHTEAWQVPGDKNFTYRLNQIFEDKGGLSFYNVGVSSHSYDRILLHLDDGLTYFKPSKYVIIEVKDFPVAKLKAVVSGLVTDADYGFKDSWFAKFTSQSIFGADKPIRYHASLGLREMYFNVRLFLKKRAGKREALARTSTSSEPDVENIDRFLQMQAEIAKKHGVQLIVVNHWRLKLQKDGTCKPSTDFELLDAYKRLSEKNGIVFIDMIPAFMKEYEETQRLPYGCFMNDLAGAGHLNRVGHRLLAEEIARTIERLEAEKEAFR